MPNDNPIAISDIELPSTRTRGGKRDGAGRPSKLQPDAETLKRLGSAARIHCTTKEGAAFFGVSEMTFLRFLNEHPEAREVWDLNRELGKASLRRMQVRAAEAGSIPMMIWLGKQYLGQKDRVAEEISGPDGKPVTAVNRIEIAIVRAPRG
jgi:hypothetical protein